MREEGSPVWIATCVSGHVSKVSRTHLESQAACQGEGRAATNPAITLGTWLPGTQNKPPISELALGKDRAPLPRILGCPRVEGCPLWGVFSPEIPRTAV